MSSFIKDFVESINNDLNLLREEGFFNYSEKYNIFVSFYILGIHDAKKFLANVDNKDNINIDLINTIKTFINEYNNQINLVLDEKAKERIKSILKSEILKMYYQGFIFYLNSDKTIKSQKAINVLSNHFDIKYDGNYNLIESSIKDVIEELIFRHIILDIFNFDNKVR